VDARARPLTRTKLLRSALTAKESVTCSDNQQYSVSGEVRLDVDSATNTRESSK